MEDKKPNGTDNEMLDPNDFEETDSTDSDDKENGEKGTEKEPNSDGKSTEELEKEDKKAKDAHYAKLRREKEAKEKAEREAEQKAREQKIREEAILQGKMEMAKVNTYTDEPITDEEDLKNFEIMKQLDAEGKDPINDFPKRLAEINRKKAADAKKQLEDEQKEQSSRQTKIANEIKELREKYPDLNTAQLADDELFKEVQKGKAGRWSLVEIYELYLSEKEKREAEKADKESKDTVDKSTKKFTSTPSSKANGKTITKKVSDMTAEEFAEYWENKYGS